VAGDLTDLCVGIKPQFERRYVGQGAMFLRALKEITSTCSKIISLLDMDSNLVTAKGKGSTQQTEEGGD
jgi:hypothetical protein